LALTALAVIRRPSPSAQTDSPLVETVGTLLIVLVSATGGVAGGIRVAGPVNASSELVRTNLGTGRPEAVGGVAPVCANANGKSHIHREAINNLMKESA
jgi:hypothetical protein